MNKVMIKNSVILALSGIALMMMYKNIIKPIMGDSDSTNQEMLQSDLTLQDVPEMAAAVNSIKSASGSAVELVSDTGKFVDLASINGAYKPKRNPFYMATKKSVQQGAKKRRSKKRPILSAVMSGPIEKFAVINGELVSEGQSINGIRVVKITSDQVLAIGPEGNISLNLSTTLQGSNYE
jgi:acetyl/propionyl-CoA carboxylase alpha subunit